MAEVFARDVIRVLPQPDGTWRWVRDYVVGRWVRREWTALPAIDRDTAILDALGLLVEEPGYPRRAKVLSNPRPRSDTPPWRTMGLTPWGP